ncbi:glycosyltransferase family 4 protein [uncultured Ornithinimicrobium sp.]|uniref:glycosyltransferase family 4 protein n=1 Tax=uncultured Ornithinimicrobium sp. TaxID=259307 RepID=UPI002597944B|nr:glycosyltransferase family 4 protein [uncultured Ornithinimicrobium sp.]
MTELDHHRPDPPALRVLLISPVPGIDPQSGDVTYTRQLLDAPPPGVVYTTYDQAIADGNLVELGTRHAIRASRRGDRWWQLLIGAARKCENLLRRSGLAYREQIRVFKVKPGSFDLIHVHVFHHRFIGAHPPVVASAGGPLRWVYTDAWGWGVVRVAVAELIDRTLGWLWDATMCGARLGRADLFIGPSDYLREWLQQRGWPGGRIAVQPNYLAVQRTPPLRAALSPRTLGFVARDFDAKGGAEVLAAFADLSQRYPSLRLHIVGSPQRTVSPEITSRVKWTPEVPREELLNTILPAIDLLIYPSRCDTGVPYSSMEALAQGIPAVVSDYRSLPDLVGADAGLVCRAGDANSVVSAVKALLEPQTYGAASAAATTRFSKRFSAVSQAPRLRSLYDRTVRFAIRPPATHISLS